jgi:hypothetical protein
VLSPVPAPELFNEPEKMLELELTQKYTQQPAVIEKGLPPAKP